MADAGFHCVAPDWIGFGFSDKPYPKYGFDYTGLCFIHDSLSELKSNCPLWISFWLLKPTWQKRSSMMSWINYLKLWEWNPLSFWSYRCEWHVLFIMSLIQLLFVSHLWTIRLTLFVVCQFNGNFSHFGCSIIAY